MRWRHPRSPNLRLLRMGENRPAIPEGYPKCLAAGSPDSKIGEPKERKPWGRHLKPSPGATTQVSSLQCIHYPKLPKTQSKIQTPQNFKTHDYFGFKLFTKLTIPSSQGTSISIPSPPEILLLPSVPSLGVAVAHGPCVVDSWRPLSTPPDDGFMASEGWEKWGM